MRRLILAALLLSVTACSEEAVAFRGQVVESSAGTVELGLESGGYAPAARVGGASLSGAVSVASPVSDSVAVVTTDARECGDTVVIREARAPGALLGNALVWVEGIKTGKPLPETRRTTVTMERCQFGPRLTAVVAGSTINVFSRDRLTHDVRFYREGSGTPVARVLTVDAGQVVPSEAIAAEAGIVEARCERHPWARGYVAVFEHPYFAVTDDAGNFTIDQLPPGTYTVKVWHEGMSEPAAQRVAVSAGGSGRLDFAVNLN